MVKAPNFRFKASSGIFVVAKRTFPRVSERLSFFPKPPNSHFPPPSLVPHLPLFPSFLVPALLNHSRHLHVLTGAPPYSRSCGPISTKIAPLCSSRRADSKNAPQFVVAPLAAKLRLTLSHLGVPGGAVALHSAKAARRQDPHTQTRQRSTAQKGSLGV